MDFGQLPYDTQYCPINVTAEGGDDTCNTDIRWMPASSEAEIGHTALPNAIGLKFNDWQLTDFAQQERIGWNGAMSATVGYFENPRSFAEAYVPLVRSPQSFEIYLYASFLLVGLSYLGFWINPAATPARVALGIITILTVVNLQVAIAKKVPHATNTPWLVIFTRVCMFFNAAAFVEQCIVNYALKMRAMVETDERARFTAVAVGENARVEEEMDEEEEAADAARSSASAIARICRA